MQTGHLRRVQAAFLIGALTLLMLFAAPAAVSDSPNPAAYTTKTKQSTAFFSTTVALSVQDDFSKEKNVRKFEDCWQEVKDVLRDIENAVSVSNPDSDIALFNALPEGGSMTITEHTANILLIVKDMYAELGGMFDPTVAPLVDLWGFTPRFNTNRYQPQYPYDPPALTNGHTVPDERYVGGFKRLVNFDGIIITGDTDTGYVLWKEIPSVEIDGVLYQAQLDLGGVAKGYAADVMRGILDGYGYTHGYFSNGSSSMVLLRNASPDAVADGTKAFTLGIRKPRDGANEQSGYTTLQIRDRALSTSGDYDHSFTADGIIYSHIINPATGFPINMPKDGEPQKGIAMATVFSDSAAVGECLSTALCVMPLNDALDYINSIERDITVYMVLYNAAYDFYEVISSEAAENITIRDPAYVPASETDAEGNIVYTGTLLN